MTELLLDSLLQRYNSSFYIYGSVLRRTALIMSNEVQHKAVYVLYCKFTLHVSGANLHHQEYTKL